MAPSHDAPKNELRERILAAAHRLLTDGGAEAATTRAVAAAASVQAPTIYRLFGDKDGLLEATAQYAMEKYVAGKRAKAPHADPIEDLRIGWDESVAFGLSQPSLFTITTESRSPATQAGLEILRGKVRRLAERGLLRVPEDRAVALIRAAASGVVMQLLGETSKDPELSALAREAVIDAITTKKPAAKAGMPSAAITLAAGLDDLETLSAGERLLLSELLARIAGGKKR